PLAARPQRAVPRLRVIVLRHRAVPLTLLGTGELTMVGTQRAVPFRYAATSCRGRARWIAREAGPPAPQQPRLLDRVRAALRARHYSRRTEKAYVHWIKRYIFFHGKSHPAEMGAAERSEEHTSELQSRGHLVCRLLLEKKKKQ